MKTIRELAEQDGARMSKKCGARLHSQSYATCFRHSAVLLGKLSFIRTRKRKTATPVNKIIR